ncbi:DNA starvation/stationary phase protection protein [uncultured Maribacter sp.]|uniref:Dps family protein n=1 Tax=uncultured Maribacter sp. TaxID=431308 RepID=UPI002615D830|nr:DNA starvation/stationary phase protection protein [uncultured Maribacter sp.]
MSYLKMNENKIEPVVDALNLLLANYNVYYQKLRSFHWNILGENFFVLHNKFEELYTDARIKIDEIAERILTLRYHPVSDFSAYLKMAKIKEESALLTDKQMVGSILEDHGLLLEQMRIIVSKANAAGDEGTIDVIGGYIRELEKTSWMLNAWKKDTREQLKTNKMERVS